MIFDYSNIVSLFELPAIMFFAFILQNVKFENGTEKRKYDGKCTILIPCYGKSNYIVNTVKSCTEQTVPTNVIVLLMDKNSQSKKEELEKNPLVKCICTERMNVVKARTHLVDICPTDWFIFLDADDLLAPNFVEILSKEDGAIRYGGARGSFNQPYQYSMLPRFPDDAIANILCLNNTALMHKDVFYDIGYDQDFFNGGEDTDFAGRLLLKQKWKISYNIDAFYIYTRDSENQLTKNWEPFHDSVFRSYKKCVPVWKKGLAGAEQTEPIMKFVFEILDDFTEDRIMSMYHYLTYGDINFKRKLDNFAAKKFSEGLNNPDAKEILILDANVYTIDDLLDVYDKLPVSLTRLYKMSPVDTVFKLLKDYKCEIRGSRNLGITQVDNKNFTNYSKRVYGNSEVGRLAEIFRGACRIKTCLQKC